jgi:hypothetical protein
VVSGEISALTWKQGTNDMLQGLPVRDSIMAIADASYFDWPVLPEAPSGLAARRAGAGVSLRWELHGGEPAKVIVERRSGNTGRWERIATQAAGTTFTDAAALASQACYRVRAANNAGESAYSNIVRVMR